jgi:hypothetical protein
MSDSLHLNAATDLTVDNSVGKTAQQDSPVFLGKYFRGRLRLYGDHASTATA